MAGGGYASGKHALAISDRSGLRFPYSEMVREWNGALVHYSEFEAKQPQLDPKPVGSDPQALFNPRPQRASTPVLILLDNNPFTSIIHSGTTYVNVYSEDHQRKAGDIVRFRGPPQVTASSGFLKIAFTGTATPGEYARAKSLFVVIGFDEIISILPDLLLL